MKKKKMSSNDDVLLLAAVPRRFAFIVLARFCLIPTKVKRKSDRWTRHVFFITPEKHNGVVCGWLCLLLCLLYIFQGCLQGTPREKKKEKCSLRKEAWVWWNDDGNKVCLEFSLSWYALVSSLLIDLCFYMAVNSTVSCCIGTLRNEGGL